MQRLILAGIAGLSLALAAASPQFAASFAEKIEPCLACHGEKGLSENIETPSLGGQPENYLLTQMFTFREKLRLHELMNEMAKALSDDDLRMISVAIAKLPAPAASSEPADAARIERAKALITKGKCNICHQPKLQGLDQVPRIAAQREDYLLKSLRDYKSGARVGYDPAMIEVMQGITDADIIDLSHYLARTP